MKNPESDKTAQLKTSREPGPSGSSVHQVQSCKMDDTEKIRPLNLYPNQHNCNAVWTESNIKENNTISTSSYLHAAPVLGIVNSGLLVYGNPSVQNDIGQPCGQSLFIPLVGSNIVPGSSLEPKLMENSSHGNSQSVQNGNFDLRRAMLTTKKNSFVGAPEVEVHVENRTKRTRRENKIFSPEMSSTCTKRKIQHHQERDAYTSKYTCISTEVDPQMKRSKHIQHLREKNIKDDWKKSPEESLATVSHTEEMVHVVLKKEPEQCSISSDLCNSGGPTTSVSCVDGNNLPLPQIKLEPDDNDLPAPLKMTALERGEDHTISHFNEPIRGLHNILNMNSVENLNTTCHNPVYNISGVNSEVPICTDVMVMGSAYSAEGDKSLPQDRMKSTIQKLAKEILQLKGDLSLLRKQYEKMIKFVQCYFSDVILQIFKRMAGILVNQCNLCNKPFSSKMGPSCQNCGKVWECPICNKEFSNRNNYSEHMTSHQPDSNKKEKPDLLANPDHSQDAKELLQSGGEQMDDEINTKSETTSSTQASVSRFKSVLSEEELDSIARAGTKPKSSTLDKQTNWGVNVFKEWLAENDFDTAFETFDASILNSRLRVFYASLQTKNRYDYSKSSLVGIRSAISRYINGPPFNKKMNIMKDSDFKSSNSVFVALITKIQHDSSKNISKKAITEEDIQKLYASGAFALDNPVSLQNKVFWDTMIHFSDRKTSELSLLRRDSFCKCKDDIGRYYYKMTSKDGSMWGNDKEIRMYADLENPAFCPVASFDLYLSKLCKVSNSFFQQPLLFPKKCVWYAPQQIGKNKLHKWMSDLSRTTGLSQRYTNQCIRVSVSSYLKEKRINLSTLLNLTTDFKHFNSSDRNNQSPTDSGPKKNMQTLCNNSSSNPLAGNKSATKDHDIPNYNPSHASLTDNPDAASWLVSVKCQCP